ncbi:hypothetical protein SLE2022_040230 [Rubroshorea leprosula]
MVAIFEHRNIEKTDLERELKFPFDAILTNLSPDHQSNLSSGKSPKLVVKDDQGGTHWLTVEKRPKGTYFTNGWKDFRIAKRIEENDKISLYKEENHSSPGGQCTYRIEVEPKDR